jgi:hypothetical protein
MLPPTQTVISRRTRGPRRVWGSFPGASSVIGHRLLHSKHRQRTPAPAAEIGLLAFAVRKPAGLAPPASAPGKAPASSGGVSAAPGGAGHPQARNEMLCIGDRSNYDAQVLVQASGQPHAGIVTSSTGAFSTREAPAEAGAAHAARARRAKSTAALRGAQRGRALAPGSDKPARHIRRVTHLLESRPVFAW